MKSMNMISTTGRSPLWAAPIATPQTAPSLIGVLSTRSRPNSSARPAVARYGPPSATSSPSTITRSSARIAVASVSLIDSMKVISDGCAHAYTSSPRRGQGQARGWRVRTARPSRPPRRPARGWRRPPAHPAIRCSTARGSNRAIGSRRPPLLVGERIAVLLRVALVVAAAAVGEALEQKRTVAAAARGRGSRRTPPRPRRRRCPRPSAQSNPYGATTSLTRSTTVCADRGVNSANPLFSHTKTSGSSHSAARFTVSLK